MFSLVYRFGKLWNDHSIDLKKELNKLRGARELLSDLVASQIQEKIQQTITFCCCASWCSSRTSLFAISDSSLTIIIVRSASFELVAIATSWTSSVGICSATCYVYYCFWCDPNGSIFLSFIQLRPSLYSSLFRRYLSGKIVVVSENGSENERF